MPNRPLLPLFRAARLGFLTLVISLNGCAVVAVAAVGAAVDLVVPDGKD